MQQPTAEIPFEGRQAGSNVSERDRGLRHSLSEGH